MRPCSEMVGTKTRSAEPGWRDRDPRGAKIWPVQKRSRFGVGSRSAAGSALAGGREPASGEIRSRSRVSVSKTRGTRIVIVDRAPNNPPSTLHRARVDPGFLYRRAGVFLPCFSILSSASDEIWTFSAVSTCGESPVAAWGAPPMPIIPPMRGKPCILTSLLPGDAALTVPRSVTAEERWVRGPRSNSPESAGLSPFPGSIGTRARDQSHNPPPSTGRRTGHHGSHWRTRGSRSDSASLG